VGRRRSEAPGRRPRPSPDLIEAVADRTGPVERARGLAELLAPVDMILLAGVTHGLAPDEVEAYGKPLRLMTDLAQRRLSTVGSSQAKRWSMT